MTPLQSNADAILLAVPMVILLFVALFRLDELVGRAPRQPYRGRRLTARDEKGNPVCTDPEPCHHSLRRQKY